MPLAVQLIIAEFEVTNGVVGVVSGRRHGTSGSVIEVGRLDVIETAPVLVVRCREHHRKWAVAIRRDVRTRGSSGTAESAARGNRHIDDAGAAQGFVSRADVPLNERGAILGSRLRRDFDGAAKSFRILTREVRFGHGDGADQTDRDRIEGHRAIAAERRCIIGGGKAQTAKRRAVQVGIEAAAIDVAPLALVGLERYSGNSAYRLGHADIRYLTYFLVRGDIDQIRGFHLRRPRDGDGRALRQNYDALERAHFADGYIFLSGFPRDNRHFMLGGRSSGGGDDHRIYAGRKIGKGIDPLRVRRGFRAGFRDLHARIRQRL